MSTLAEPTNRDPADRRPDGSAAPSAPAPAAAGGFSFAGPRLSELGKRIEMVRLDRGVSKQELARAAGTSRQQLWRVMTGKSELTAVLCQRLASVLDIDSRTLSAASLAGAHQPAATVTLSHTSLDTGAPDSLASYLASPAALQRTLRTLPAGDDGIPIKCALLNAVEERARQARQPIPAWLFRVRASVLGGAI